MLSEKDCREEPSTWPLYVLAAFFGGLYLLLVVVAVLLIVGRLT